MKLLFTLNPEQVTEDEARTYNFRGASRAVVFDADGSIGLMYAKNVGTYKLPGGGIDEGENPRDALLRECLEELGCDVEIQSELGECLEYRRADKLKQESFCFIARVKGEKGKPNLTEKESAAGFEVVWVPLDEAIKLVRDGVYTKDGVVSKDPFRFVQTRDGKILLAAKEE